MQTSEDSQSPAFPCPNGCRPERWRTTDDEPRAARSADQGLPRSAPTLRFRRYPGSGSRHIRTCGIGVWLDALFPRSQCVAEASELEERYREESEKPWWLLP